MSNVTDDAKAIRNAFKAAGIKASVRSERYAGGSSISVSLKSGSFAKAKEIAESFQSIHYDEVTGEILSGGNLYVHVEIDHDWVSTVGSTIAAKVQAAYEAAKAGPRNQHVEIEGLPYSLAYDGDYALLWGQSKHILSYIQSWDEIVGTVARNIIRDEV